MATRRNQFRLLPSASTHTLSKHPKSVLRNPTQLTSALARTHNTKTLESPRVLAKMVGDEGFEPATSTV